MKKWLKNTARTLVTIGGLNWGFVGLAGINLVNEILSKLTINYPLVNGIIYTSVGISAILVAIDWMK